jgi:hypothetical protein
MSESKKYVTFRDLKDLSKKEEAGSKVERYTSESSTTRTSSILSDTSKTSSTSIPSAPSTTSIPSTAKKQLNRDKTRVTGSIAPDRDFQRVPNSVTRQALQQGLFRGKSKQVWDYLWSVSRGAVIPSRFVRKSRREIKAGSGLGSMVTVDAAIDHLMSVGMIAVKPSVGSLGGNEYEVFTPEETADRKVRYTSIPSTTSTSSPTHNLVQLDVPESSTPSTTFTHLDSTKSSQPNTFFNTKNDDDTHTLLSYFSGTLLEGAKNLVGGKLSVTEQERMLWNECACVLVEELRRAAENTPAISSVPAFFTAHLRRRFAQKHKGDKKTLGLESTPKLETIKPSGAIGIQPDPAKQARENNIVGSRYSLEECRQYAEHLQRTGQGIMNPGGYATTIYRTGEADALIEKFLNPEASETQDISKCPDCRGTGFIYPDGVERGAVAKCKHSRLPLVMKLLEHISQLQLLYAEDAGYETAHLLEDLRYRCEREDITWDDTLISSLLR